MNLTTYTVNSCLLFVAKEIIEETGITITNSSVVTRMLLRHCPEAQTVKEWREAGADIPVTVRDNQRLMTEQQVARYLEHVPRACCPDLHDLMFEVYAYWDNTYNEQRWEHRGSVYDYSSDQRSALIELLALPDFKKMLVDVKEVDGAMVCMPVAVTRTGTFSCNTKYEVPVYDDIEKIAHYYITTDRMTECNDRIGTDETISREFEDMKKLASDIEAVLGCTSEFHIIKSEGSLDVFERDGSYYYNTTPTELPF